MHFVLLLGDFRLLLGGQIVIQHKGYVHQGDHAPARLQAETFGLYFTVCGKSV